MRSNLHVVTAAAIIAAGVTTALAASSVGEVNVAPGTTGSIKATHKWKTAGAGHDGKVGFTPDWTVIPDEFGVECRGEVTSGVPGSTPQFFFVIVHAGNGSRDRGGRVRARVGPKDGALGRSFGAVISDLQYALDQSLTGEQPVAKPPEAVQGPVDVTSAKGQIDLRDRGDGTVDVKFKAVYKGTVIFGPAAGAKAKGKIQLKATAASVDT